MYMYFFDSNENNMKELNKKMYNSKKNKNFTVVFFLAPWCGHCKNLKPVIDSIQNDFNKKHYNGIMARVYDDNIDKMRYKRKINGFPTISVFNNKGKYEDYTGSREKEDLNSFLVSVFEKNKKRFSKIKKSKRFKQRLKGLRKGKNVLKRISNRIRRAAKFSGKKRRRKYQMGGRRTRKRRKSRRRR